MFKIKNLKGYRKLKRMSQEELASKVGLESASVISRIENNDYNNSLKLATLEDIATVLQVNLLDLLEV